MLHILQNTYAFLAYLNIFLVSMRLQRHLASIFFIKPNFIYQHFLKQFNVNHMNQGQITDDQAPKFKFYTNAIVPFDVSQFAYSIVPPRTILVAFIKAFCFGTNFKRPIRICTKLKQSCWQAKKYLPDAIFFTLYYYNNEGIALESSQLSVQK